MNTAGHPRCERGAALAALVVLTLIVLASVAILWPKFSEYRDDFDGVRQDLAIARGKVRSLEQRPTIDELGAANASLAEVRARLSENEDALDASELAREAMVANAADLQAKLDDANAGIDVLRRTLQTTAKRVEVLEATKARLDADLLTTVESYENARRAASGKEDLLDKLDATARKLVATERALVAEREALAAKDEVLLKLGADIDHARTAIAKRDASLSILRRELSEIPIMPLPDELAKEKYYEYLNSVAEHTDRESRIATLFRAKIALTGSSYEGKADGQWRSERKKKRDDVYRASRLVYNNVNSKLRVHPDAHDENVVLLQEALEKVTGSRYEKLLQQLVDREHELKAAGR